MVKFISCPTFGSFLLACLFLLACNNKTSSYLNPLHARILMHAKIFKACVIDKCVTWTKPKYGKAKIDKAGHILVNENSTEEEREEAMTILNNRRSSHGYPMNTFQARLRQVSKKVDENSLVVQRLKRAPSIIKKLKRNQTKLNT